MSTGTESRVQVVSEYEIAPRELVHKRAAEGVLLDGWRRTGEADYRVSTRWAQAGPFYFGPDARPDPMLFIESIRQCLPLLSHVAFGVPLGHHLVWDRFSLRLAHRTAGPPRPGADAEIDVHCDEIRSRGGRASALGLSFSVRRDGGELANARTRFSIQPPAVYRRIRGEAIRRTSADPRATVPPAPLSPAAVGRTRASDVLLSATDRPDVWQLRLDLGHPVYFDHPVDHVPGALLLDAALQATRAAGLRAGRTAVPVGIDCRFHSFVELDDPYLLEIRQITLDGAGYGVAEVTLATGDAHPVFTAVVTLHVR